MDIAKYEAALNKIKDNGIDFNVEGRQAIANINSEEDQVVFTTIPYDKGWKAYIDGERVEIPTFKDAFLAIPVPKGKHTLKLVFLPQGIIVGSILFIISILLFSYYAWNLTKQSKRGKGW